MKLFLLKLLKGTRWIYICRNRENSLYQETDSWQISSPRQDVRWKLSKLSFSVSKVWKVIITIMGFEPSPGRRPLVWFQFRAPFMNLPWGPVPRTTGGAYFSKWADNSTDDNIINRNKCWGFVRGTRFRLIRIRVESRWMVNGDNPHL